MNQQDYVFTKNIITDVEQAPEVLPDMHSRILQYSKGKLSAQICCLQLPELRIYQNTVNQGLQIEMAPYFDGFSVVVLEHVSSTISNLKTVHRILRIKISQN